MSATHAGPGSASSPQRTARVAGVFYLLTFATGITSLLVRGSVGVAAGLLAAVISLVGCTVGSLVVNPLVFFGFYCLLVGYLVIQSAFLPRALGVLMMFAALGWLTYLSPSLGKTLYPYNLGPGIFGEGALAVWLLAKGVDADKWKEQAREKRA
jgi:Domain of unknown function (DUF4386)